MASSSSSSDTLVGTNETFEALAVAGKDIGQLGSLMPENLSSAPAQLVADELLSRATIEGPHASGFVLEMMMNQPNPLVQLKGALAIAQISERPEGRAALHAESAVKVVVEAMRTAMDDEVELQRHGCSSLANLVMAPPDENEAAVLDNGGLEAVLAAAKAHPFDAGVQAKACLALGNMAFGSVGEAKVLSSGGLEVVVAAMKAHAANPLVIEEGIDALVNIADGADGKKALLALGGLGVVAAAKKSHPKCMEAAGDLALKLVAAAKASHA